jgi:hypothetical protein
MNVYSIKAQRTVKIDKYTWDSWKFLEETLQQIPLFFFFFVVQNKSRKTTKTCYIGKEKSSPSM